MKRILHLVPGLNEPTNGIAVASRLIADGQRGEGNEVEIEETRDFVASEASDLSRYTEVWVHSMWRPVTMRACLKVLHARCPLVRMTHGCLDPLRYHSKYWKKLIVSPLERWLMNHAVRVVVTCKEEREWCRNWGVEGEFQRIDLSRYFNFPIIMNKEHKSEGKLHVLYLGRLDPLKGVRYLQKAVENLPVELRVESAVFGEAKERAWEWCEVLCLPTLSDNFGLVVAEALEHKRRVITTDGAPAWRGFFAEHPECGIYLSGFREGDDARRIVMIAEALRNILG